LAFVGGPPLSIGFDEKTCLAGCDRLKVQQSAPAWEARTLHGLLVKLVQRQFGFNLRIDVTRAHSVRAFLEEVQDEFYEGYATIGCVRLVHETSGARF
jgi:hypothetical protein